MTLSHWAGHGLPPGVRERAEAAVRAESRLGRLPRIGDGQRRTVNLLDSFAQLVAVAMDRAALLGELLELQMYGPPIPEADIRAALRELYGDDVDLNGDDDEFDDGPDAPGVLPRDGDGRSIAGGAIRGLVGVTGMAMVVGSGDGAEARFIPTGEQSRALVELEGRERDRAADLIVKAVKIGVKLDQVEVMRSYAGTISAALKGMVGELGLPMNDEGVLRAAQRSGLSARRAVGHDDGDPDRQIGPRLTGQEKVRVLTAALERAQREAAAEAEVIEQAPDGST